MPEPPKDRSTLATMRVIRRNLVYAVGMPPNIATEETLRKPEYFGQYGKISKIIINRNQNPGDPRRESASAYVTFAHKVRVIVPYLYHVAICLAFFIRRIAELFHCRGGCGTVS
jgi:hypothetical protein